MDGEDAASPGARLEGDGEAAVVNGACCVVEEEGSEGGEGGGRERKGPKDQMKVNVLRYEKDGEEFSYTIQVVTCAHCHYGNLIRVTIFYTGSGEWWEAPLITS